MAWIPAFAGMTMVLLALAVLPGGARADTVMGEKKLGNSGTSTAFAGQRNVIYVNDEAASIKGYWVFYKEINSDRGVYRYSQDGLEWSAASDVFPYLSLAPDITTPEQSIWYVPMLKTAVTLSGQSFQSHIVYAAANSLANNVYPTGLTADGMTKDSIGDKMFVVQGALRPDGTITWGSIRRQRAAYRGADNSATYDKGCFHVVNTTALNWDVQAQKSAAVIYSSSTNGEFVALFADAGSGTTAGAARNGIGAIGISNLKPDLSDYIGGSYKIYAFCNSSNVSDQFFPNAVSVAMAPVVDQAGAYARAILGARDRNIGAGTMGWVSISSSAKQNANDGGATATQAAEDFDGTAVPWVSNTASATDDDRIRLYGMSALNEVYTSTAHVVWISTYGALLYDRRSDFKKMFLSNPIIISGAATVFNPIIHPSLALVKQSDGSSNVYVIWVSSDQAYINYRIGKSTAISADEFGSTMTFKTGAYDAETGTYSLDYPKPSFWVNEPYPIGTIWEEADGVSFGKIITSTWIPPGVGAVSSAPASAPYTTNTYQLQLTTTGAGAGFRQWEGENPVVDILFQAGSQSEISRGSVTFVSVGTITVSVTLSSFVRAGEPYDVRVMNLDGQQVLKSSAMAVNAPQITSILDADAGSRVSCGSFPDNNGTTSKGCSLQITGNYFQNWTGVSSGTAVYPSTNTLALQTTAQVTVSTLSYAYFTDAASSMTVTYFLKVSTGDWDGGVFDLTVTNPLSGSFTQATTFYVTVPTATIFSPLSGTTTGFTVIVGSYGYTPSAGQASLLTSQVRITYQDSSPNMVWTGNGFVDATNSETFPTEETKWRDVTTQLSSSWTYTFIATDTTKVPYDGTYELAARAKTSDGGLGQPYNPIFSGTQTVVIDRLKPNISITNPGNDSAIKAASNLNPQIYVGDIGSGLTTIQILIQDMGEADGTPWAPEAWLAFNSTGTLGPAGAGEQVWVSTAGADTSKTIFALSRTTQTIILDDTTNIRRPQWQDGKRYRISVWAKDGVGFERKTSSDGADALAWQFIYDITRPTATIEVPLPALLGDTTQYLAANSLVVKTLTQISGTTDDNVSNETTDKRIIYVRFLRMNSAIEIDRCLDPNASSNPEFKLSSELDPTVAPGLAKTCWKTVSITTGDWKWDNLDTTGNNIADNDDNYPYYRVDMFYQDSGTVSALVYRKYLRLDKQPPQLGISGVSTTSLLGTGTLLAKLADGSFYGLSNGENPFAVIQGTAADTNNVSTVTWSLCYNYDGSGCTKFYDDADSSSWTAVRKWYIAGTTTTPKFAVWQASGTPLDAAITWVNGRKYQLNVTAWDFAGNQLSTVTWQFGYDTTLPKFALTNVSSATTYQTSAKLTTISGTAVDCPKGTGCAAQEASDRGA
ncbi:MAG: hypothetical protein HY747_11015, partial [Elusimicrobia bacterium]|nr:hypothetical protein [Elusimicrobiota bacterium]